VPDSVFALGALLVAIVPGFLFLQGYNRGRAQAPSPDIFVLAKAVLASLLFVSLVVFMPAYRFIESGSTVADWVRDDKIYEHRTYVLLLAWPVFIFAFLAGLGVGWAVDRLGRPGPGVRGKVAYFLKWGGFLRTETIWGSLLKDELLLAPKLLLIELKEGETVIGAFDGQSAIASDLAEVYLSETYLFEEATGLLVPQNRAVYVKGENVRTISIAPL
jgi:hypothetical protein